MTGWRTKFKKVISALTAVVLTFVFAFPVSVPTVSAVTTRKDADIICNQKLYLDNKELCDRIADGIGDLQDSVYIGDLKFDPNRLPYIMKTVVRMNPEYFYVNSKFFAVGIDGGNNIVEICPLYYDSPDVIEYQREKLDTRVNEILSLVDDDMSEFKKALIVHDEIILNCEYSSDDDHDYVTAYGALVDQVANCQGYTAAFSYIMSILGIETEVVESSKLFHVWNSVKIDGEWYNVDLTWDDPIINRFGHTNHEYFLVSDEAIVDIDDRTKDNYGFDFSVKPCTSKKYDNADYHKINTRFCYIGDDCYVIDNNYGSKYQKCLLRFDPITGEREVIKQFDVKWMSGTSATSYWENTFMSLEVHDELLYYSAPDNIYAYDVRTDKQIELVCDEALAQLITKEDYYGLLISKCNLYVSIATTPNAEYTVGLFGSCIKPDVEIGEQRVVDTKNNLRIGIMYGDVNLDKTVSVTDATDVQKYTANLTDFSDIQMICGDVNGDGVVNIVDCTLIQKYIADLI